MLVPPLLIESLEGCEEYIAKYTEGRDLRFTDKRQLRQTEQHRKRLEKVLKSPDGNNNHELRHRFSTNNIHKSSKCNNQYVNNTHFFYGNGSRLGHVHRTPFNAFDFPENTQLNRTEFTKHIQTLETQQSNIDKQWLSRAKNQVETRKTARSHSTPPNLKFTSPEIPAGKDRFELGWSTWARQTFEIQNIDENLDRPKNLERLIESSFEKSLTIAMSSLIEHVDARKLRPGFRSIQSILFSTSDNYFYALLPPDKPNDLRRARHIFHLESENEDWFIEMDTGELRSLKNAGPNNVMTLPAKQCQYPSNIIECRFSDKKMSGFGIAREIHKIREDGRMNIIGFDRMERRKVPNIQYKSERSDIRTVIVEPIKSLPAPLMTTVFCDNSSCMGCNTWSAFQKPTTSG